MRLSMAVAATLLLSIGGTVNVAGQELVRPGDPELRTDQIGSRNDTTQVWRISGDARQKGPLQIQTVERFAEGGEERLRVMFTLESERGSLTDTTIFRLPSLAPVMHSSRPVGDATWRTLLIRYGESVARGSVTEPDAAPEDFEVELSDPVFDPGVSVVILSALPLELGYEARVPMLNHESRAVQYTTYRVVGEERREVRGQTVDTWQIDVELETHTFTVWIDKQTGRTVRGETALGPDMRMLSLPPEYGAD